MDIPYQTVSFFYHLALIVWLGGIMTIGFIVAPNIFRILPRRQAGELVAPIHRTFQTVELICIVVLLVTSAIMLRVWQNLDLPAVIRYLLIFAMVVGGVYHGSVVMRKLRVLKQGTPPLEELPATDPRSLAFSRWHRISVAVNMAILVTGLGVLFLS